jgi:hypothetical protein
MSEITDLYRRFLNEFQGLYGISSLSCRKVKNLGGLSRFFCVIPQVIVIYYRTYTVTG